MPFQSKPFECINFINVLEWQGIASKVAIQLNVKLGGEAWVLDIPVY